MKFPINKIIFLYILTCINTSFAATDSQANAKINTAQENPDALWDAAKAENQKVIDTSNTEKDNANANQEITEYNEMNYSVKALVELVESNKYEYSSKHSKEDQDRVKSFLLKKYRKELSAVVQPGFDSLNLGAKIKWHAIKKTDNDKQFDSAALSNDDKTLAVSSSRIYIYDISDINKEKCLKNFKRSSGVDLDLCVNNRRLTLSQNENALWDMESDQDPFIFRGINRGRSLLTRKDDLVVFFCDTPDRGVVKAEYWKIDDQNKIADKIDNINLFPRDLIKIISGYASGGIHKLHEVEFSCSFRSYPYASNADGTIILMVSRNSGICVIDNFIPKNFFSTTRDIRGIHGIDVSFNGKFILFKTSHDKYYLLDSGRFYKEGFYSSSPIVGRGAVFSNDGQFLVYFITGNTGEICRIVINRISNDADIKEICSFAIKDWLASVIGVSSNCDFLVINACEYIKILDISNTWIMEELSLAQLVYTIKLHGGIGNYNYTDSDMDKIFANMDPRFVKRLKDHFALRQ